MTSPQKYDLEFKQVHTIRGHSLHWLVAKEMNAKEEDPFGWEEEIKIYNVE